MRLFAVHTTAVSCRRSAGFAVLLTLIVPFMAAWSQQGTTEAQKSTPVLFVVEIQVGKNWDFARPPNEQPYFKEHSANLKRLRDAGQLLMGARYADKGLLVLAAADEKAARAALDADPSFKADTFQYLLHKLNVFYPGMVAPPASRQTTADPQP